MKAKILSFVVTLIVLLSYGNVNAQNAHFLSKNPPSLRDAGTTLCVSGTLHGLGNYAGQEVSIQIFAEGTVYTECSNPAGNVAPGQSSTTTLSSVPTSFPIDRQGRLSFRNLCTDEPDVTSQSAGCPNSKWTGRASDVVFTRVWMVVGGETIDLTPYL